MSEGKIEMVGEFGDWLMFRAVEDGELFYCHKDTREISREEPEVVRNMRELLFKPDKDPDQQPSLDVPPAYPEPQVEADLPPADSPPAPSQTAAYSRAEQMPPSEVTRQPTEQPRYREVPASHVSQISFGGYDKIDPAAAAAEPIISRGMGYDRQSVQPRSERMLLRQGHRTRHEPDSYQERTTAASLLREPEEQQHACKFGRRATSREGAAGVLGGGVPAIGSDRSEAIRGRAGAAAAQVQRGNGGRGAAAAPFALFGATSDAKPADSEEAEVPWTQRGKPSRRPAPPRENVSAAPDMMNALQCATGERGLQPVPLAGRRAVQQKSPAPAPWNAQPDVVVQRRQHLQHCPQQVIEEVAQAALAARCGPKSGRRAQDGAGYASAPSEVFPTAQPPAQGRHRGVNAITSATAVPPWVPAP